MTTALPDTSPVIHWWDLMAAPRLSTAQAATRLKQGWQLHALPVSYCSAGAAGSYSHLLRSPDGGLAQITTRTLARLPKHTPASAVRFFSPVLVLQVPFDEKDTVKAMGAKWNPSLRKWCIRFEDELRFTRWLPSPAKIHDITADLIGS